LRGAEFKAWRLALGLTQTEAADALGISKRMVIYYEQGRYPVPKSVSLACFAVSVKKIKVGDNAMIWFDEEGAKSVAREFVARYGVRDIEDDEALDLYMQRLNKIDRHGVIMDALAGCTDAQLDVLAESSAALDILADYLRDELDLIRDIVGDKQDA